MPVLYGTIVLLASTWRMNEHLPKRRMQKLRCPDDALCALQDIPANSVSAAQDSSMCEAFLRWLVPADIADSVMYAI